MNFSQFTTDKQIVDFCLKDQANLRNKRALYEPLWRKETAVFQPRNYNMFREFNDGKQFGSKIYFDYPALASHKFALGMNGHSISKSSPWVQMVMNDPRKMESDKVKEYLQACTETLLLSFAHSSSFYTSAYWAARDYGVIGTVVVWPDENKIDGKMEYKPISIGSVCLQKDFSGKYVTLTQECKISAIDLLDKFGQNNLPADVLKDAKGEGTSDNPFKEYDLLIYLCYNSEYKPNSLNPEDLKYKVFYILYKTSDKNKQLIMKSGRRTFPIVISYGDRHDSPYGISLAAECLNTGLRGNKLVELMLDDANKAIGGIWRVSDTIGKPDLRAQGVNKVKDASEFIENIYKPTGWQICEQYFQHLKDTCDEWFFVRFFEMLSNPDLGQITAYQAARMQGEKVSMMSTAIGGHENYLEQAIDLQWDYEDTIKHNMPDPPDELFDDNGNQAIIRPKFIGNLAQLQRQAFKTMGLIDWATAVQSLSQTWPSTKIKVNELELVEQLAQGMGVQEKCVKDDDEVSRILQEMRQQEEAQADSEMALEGAKAIPALNKKIEAGSPMELLAGAMK